MLEGNAKRCARRIQELRGCPSLASATDLPTRARLRNSGAYEGQPDLWVAGATIRIADLANLILTSQVAADGSLAIVVTGIPVDLKLPADFKVKVGNAPAGGQLTQATDFSTNLTTATLREVPVPAQRGWQTTSYGLTSHPDDWLTLADPIQTDDLRIVSLANANCLAADPVPVFLYGLRIAPTPAPLFQMAIDLGNSAAGAAPRFNYPVPVILDTAPPGGAKPTTGRRRRPALPRQHWQRPALLD